MKTRLFSLGLAAIVFASSTAAADTRQDAVQFAHSEMAKLLLQCGGKVYVRYEGAGFVELMDPHIIVKSHPVTASVADKLNGNVVDWEGTVRLTDTAHRWVGQFGSKWMNGDPTGDPDGKHIHVVNDSGITHANGQWVFKPALPQANAYSLTYGTCDDLAPYLERLNQGL